MQINLEINNEIKDFDVLVAGGGLAGFAAALSAARNGAKTILIDKNGFLGGLGVVGAVVIHNYFNVFDATPGAPRLRVAAGIAQELIEKLKQRRGAIDDIRVEKFGEHTSMITIVEPEITKTVLNEMLLEGGVKLLLHSTIIQVLTEEKEIQGVVIWNKAGFTYVRAKQYIDCTGDGDLAAYAGVPFKHFKANKPGAYPGGFTFRLCNVDLERMEADLEKKGLIIILGHDIKPGGMKPELVRLKFDIRKLGLKRVFEFYAVSLRPNELTYVNCLNYGPNDGLDPEILTQSEIYIRKELFEVVKFLRENVDGCENCYPAGTSPYVGQRRTRAIHCEYELTKQDCLEGRQFNDQIGCFSFIDISKMYVKDSGAFGIPYRAIVPLEIRNLLVAGRTISSDNIAFAATRNTVCSMITGQAAGTSASISIKQGIPPSEIEVKLLQEKLVSDGALLKPINLDD